MGAGWGAEGTSVLTLETATVLGDLRAALATEMSSFGPGEEFSVAVDSLLTDSRSLALCWHVVGAS